MARIQFEGSAFECGERESVLDCLERHGAGVPSSCRSGVCQSCLLRAVGGAVPANAQKGLKPALQQQGYFLSCMCYPESDLDVVRADGVSQRVPARIAAIERLNDTILNVRMTPEAPFSYRSGQFANFVRDGVVRSYSIASLPLDDHLEFHVAVMPGGRMSGWLANEAAHGDVIELAGPLGDCFYVDGDPEQPLLLAGTGTGLAPLYGVLRDALAQGHTGPIHLFHGSLYRKGLYLVDALRAIADAHPNVTYTPCVLNDDGTAVDVTVGAIDALVLDHQPSYKNWGVYLCGHPDMVRLLQRKIFLKGAALKDIHADAFLPSAAK